jgi:hypothetical protein
VSEVARGFGIPTIDLEHGRELEVHLETRPDGPRLFRIPIDDFSPS